MAVAIKPDPDIKHLMLKVEILAVKTNLATMLRSTRQPPAVTSISMVLAVSETPAHSLMVNKSSEISTTRFPQRFCRDFSRTKVLTQAILNNLSHMLLDHLWTTSVVLLAAMFLEVAVAATEVFKMEDSPAEVDIEEVAMPKANTQDPWMLTQAPTSRHPSARTSIVVSYFIITNHIRFLSLQRQVLLRSRWSRAQKDLPRQQHEQTPWRTEQPPIQLQLAVRSIDSPRHGWIRFKLLPSPRYCRPAQRPMSNFLRNENPKHPVTDPIWKLNRMVNTNRKRPWRFSH